MNEIQFGQFGLSVVLAMVTGVIFKICGECITERLKVAIMVLCGVSLGILAIPYQALPWTVVNIVNCLLVGIAAASSASGLYSWLNKSGTIDVVARRTPKPPVIAYILIPLLLFAPMTFHSCAITGTTNQQTVPEPTEVKVWKALKISVSAYDASMLALKDLYASGTIPKDTAQKAWDVGEAFYLAQKGAITALRTYKEVKTAQSEGALNMAIVKAGDELTKFIALVAPFLAKHYINDLQAAEAGLKK